MKYSQAFERDYAWYLAWKDTFTFDGSNQHHEKVRYAADGQPAKQAFYAHDSIGKTVPTAEPELLTALYKCKGGINFQIKEWVAGRREGTLPRADWEAIQQEFSLLPWMVDACERQLYR